MFKDKRFIWVLLGLTMAVQIYVPASMIWSKERVIEEGQLMKFRIAPIDPNDPFRGKFIILSFLESIVDIESGDLWDFGEKAYAVLGEDSLGYAYPIRLQREKAEEEPYLEVTVATFFGESVRIEYPFNKFFMEESKAPLAEQLYWEAIGDTSVDFYALVYVHEGVGVLEDVQIDGVSIKDLVEEAN